MPCDFVHEISFVSITEHSNQTRLDAISCAFLLCQLILDLLVANFAGHKGSLRLNQLSVDDYVNFLVEGGPDLYEPLNLL